jgi:hypothetical protein
VVHESCGIAAGFEEDSIAREALIKGSGDESQTIRVGTAQTSTYIAGVNNAGVSGTAVLVDANGRLGITLSSARYKRDIETMASRSEGLLKLRPVTFVYKEDRPVLMVSVVGSVGYANSTGFSRRWW